MEYICLFSLCIFRFFSPRLLRTEMWISRVYFTIKPQFNEKFDTLMSGSKTHLHLISELKGILKYIQVTWPHLQREAKPYEAHKTITQPLHIHQRPSEML